MEGEIRAPARRIACLAAVHVGFLAALGEAGRIVAVDAGRHVYDAGVRARVAERRVVEVGSGSGLNVERLLAAKPDLVLANAVGASENAALDRLRRAGVPVLVTAEWMENHPLARAEWIRLIGLLVGAEKRADSLFAVVEAGYRRRAEDARMRQPKPTVLLGAPFRDQWVVAGGRSFMARLLQDAGAEYLWAADTTAGGVPLGFEAVLARARGAEVWLHPGEWRGLDDGFKRDARFAAFSAFKRGDVYEHDARRRDDGADDYWESGAARPDRVLADLVSIFHGEEDSLYYYRRLPP
jgi:iron complex transport system substrate-binding protein